jgi:hypothetical protein
MCSGVEKKVAPSASLVYRGERGLGVQGVVRRTWAPKGKTPIVRLPASWQMLSTLGVITLTGQFLQHPQAGAIKTVQVLMSSEHLLILQLQLVGGEPALLTLAMTLLDSCLVASSPLRPFPDPQVELVVR